MSREAIDLQIGKPPKLKGLVTLGFLKPTDALAPELEET